MRIKTSFYSLDWGGKSYILQTETLDWKDEQEARKVYELSKVEIVSMEEVTTCQNCYRGLVVDVGEEEIEFPCECCNGDYLKCANCSPAQIDEGTNTVYDDIKADMKGHL